jgi:hypothetical protein
MNTRMGKVCDRYTDEQLDVIADFLQQTVAAGRGSADKIDCATRHRCPHRPPPRSPADAVALVNPVMP